MDCLLLLRQGVLFIHLVAFAIALASVLREDLALLAATSIDVVRLADTARTIGSALSVLWITGLLLVAIDAGFDPGAIGLTPKLAAKLFVVLALTANGVGLHCVAFPILRRQRVERPAEIAAVTTLGAISTTSWLYAAFIGIARSIAPFMTFADFVALYGALLMIGVAVATVFVRPHMERLLITH